MTQLPDDPNLSPNSAIAVANSTVCLANDARDPVTPMKLQKLIYYAHGFNLSLLGLPLIDEEVQAWKYGPVVNSVYHTFKGYGSNPILEPQEEAVYDPATESISFGTPYVSQSRRFHRDLLQAVWDEYGNRSGIELSNMTHLSGTAWREVWSVNKFNLRFLGIPNHLIREEFDMYFRNNPHVEKRLRRLVG
jgi:uncharacterized phage-associated protein